MKPEFVGATAEEPLNLTPQRVAAALMLVFVWSLGCSPGQSGYRAPDGTPIVLISVDTLRSDRLPVYGYNGVETPAIEKLRNDGILFERAYTHVPLTLPAHASLLTGLLPPDHGVRDNLGYAVDPGKGLLLQQKLKEAGYATGAGVSAFVLRRATGLDAGFDFYEDGIDLRPDASSAGLQSLQRPGGETLDKIRPWLRSVAGRSFFLLFHIFEPHTPYDPPAEFAARYDSDYDGEVAAADSIIGNLLDELRNLGVYEKTLVVFLSDHGEGLGEHGESEHGVFLYRSTLQVPMILKLPKSERAGETVSRPVQLIDVYPTLMLALELPFEASIRGTSLLAEASAESVLRPVFAETHYPRLHFGWSDLAAVIRDRHHFIDAPEPELYDLVSDPDQADNLVAIETAIASDLEEIVGRYDRNLAAPEAEDAEPRRQLQALGYVGEATLTGAGDLPDPKTRIGVLAEIRCAHRLFADREFEAAAMAFQSIVDESPGIEDAWQYLALAHIASGRPGEAVATYQSALVHVPHSQRLSLRAAMLLFRMGRLEEASARARFAIPYDPGAAHALLAQIEFVRGNLDLAESEAREALSVKGDRRPQSRLVLADVLIARGQPVRAAGELSRALENGIRDESIYSKLAMTYLRIGEIDQAEQLLSVFDDTDDLGLLVAMARTAMARGMWAEATERLEHALRISPSDPMVQLNLGIVALSEGRFDEAEGLLERAVTGEPDSLDGWNALGSVRAQRGDLKGAISAWSRAYEINPSFLDVVFNLGVAYAQAGWWEQAVTRLEDYVVRAEPGPRRDRALAMIRQIQSQQER
jgi:arylsulfatase A-like enzyme/tetratricopeptide (TPR) repeat protein